MFLDRTGSQEYAINFKYVQKSIKAAESIDAKGAGPTIGVRLLGAWNQRLEEQVVQYA